MNATEQEKGFIADLNAGEDILGIYADWLKETDQWWVLKVRRLMVTYPEQDWARQLHDQLLREGMLVELAALHATELARQGFAAVICGNYISEIENATFDLWYAHGPAIVAQHPITFVRLNESERSYIVDYMGAWHEDYRSTRREDWYWQHWDEITNNSDAIPLRKTREEAEAWTSKVLLSWARKQAGLGL